MRLSHAAVECSVLVDESDPWVEVLVGLIVLIVVMSRSVGFMVVRGGGVVCSNGLTSGIQLFPSPDMTLPKGQAQLNNLGDVAPKHRWLHPP